MLDIRKAFEVDLNAEYLAIAEELTQVLVQLDDDSTEDSSSLSNWIAPLLRHTFSDDPQIMLYFLAGPKRLTTFMHALVLLSMVAGIRVYRKQLEAEKNAEG